MHFQVYAACLHSETLSNMIVKSLVSNQVVYIYSDSRQIMYESL